MMHDINKAVLVSCTTVIECPQVDTLEAKEDTWYKVPTLACTEWRQKLLVVHQCTRVYTPVRLILPGTFYCDVWVTM